ncbi:MAG: hypothetical protein HY329_21810 [Chloroflexi bacterium]|nr:hypothetical protein [Chloroflexota bacterium]
MEQERKPWQDDELVEPKLLVLSEAEFRNLIHSVAAELRRERARVRVWCAEEQRAA